MPNLNRNFIKGIMQKDLDERLLPNGMVRHAENILIVNSESSDIGSIQNSYSNKQLTFYDFGNNPKCLLGFSDEFNDKLYWFVKSDTGCYLVEWDNRNEVLSIVLGDTRPLSTRVLNLNEKHLITGIGKIVTEDRKKSLLTWTDDNMQPCCINIERSKKYGINGFELEDILLIKKPPKYAPKLIPILQNSLGNNMEEKFLLFSYRYKYLDGEFSALSDFSNYNFTAKDFKIDYFTLDNVGMVNKYNAVKITFNTGDKRVTDIQLVFKESNSNNLYIVETFSKSKEGWGDNQLRNHIFSNNKVYMILPEEELYRTFDNVPLKAKSLTLIGNRIVFGNYVEGFNMVDSNGNKTIIDYAVSVINENISSDLDLHITTISPNKFELSNPAGHLLIEGITMNIVISVLIDNQDVYTNSFSLILENNYESLADFIDSEEFEIFFGIINSDYITNYNTNNAYEVPDGWVVDVETKLTYALVSGVPTFNVDPVIFIDTLNGNTVHVIDTSFSVLTEFDLSSISNNESCKTNRDYEVGLVYQENFNRKSTVITGSYNTVYIPQTFAVFKNKLKIEINHKAPAWADRYKIVVKAKPLQYDTIYINEFYNEGFFVWCRLVAENKDKVSVGDELIIKVAAGEVINNPLIIKVLDKKELDKDFIKDNKDKLGNDIIEPAGVYMKINPSGFSMDLDDFQVYQDERKSKAGKGYYPKVYLDLFSQVIDNPDPTPDSISEITIPSGSEIYIYLHSGFKYDRGWRSINYEKTYYAQRDYASIEDWFIENFIGKNLYAEDNFDEVLNYKDNVALKRGFLTYGNPIPNPVFTEDPAGKLYLYVKGLESGGSGGRKGYLDAKIRVRTNLGLYVFETNPKQAETEIFYETEQSFDIINGNHQGNNQNQDFESMLPCVIESNFFNCYTQGNGVESYKIKDGFNKNYLNIDTRPSTTSIEEYKEIRRSSDLTYGEPFVESTNVNGLNVFNLSKANYKELDKQYGSIQKIHSRDNDILVLQEEKAFKVLFEKDVVYGAEGSSTLRSIDKVLGQHIPYLGENGIGLNPESFSVNDYQVFYANSRKGAMNRLSIDGTTEIVNGMKDYFRDLFIQKPNAKKIGGFDPYHKQYFISIGEEPEKIYNLECGNSIIKNRISSTFSYNLNLNTLVGDIVINYNFAGNATITAQYDGNIYVDSNVTGLGNLTIPRVDITKKNVIVTITPVSEVIDFEISNNCPSGLPLKVVSVILNDENDIDATIINRYRWTGSSFYSENDVFTNSPITRFSEEFGIEGQSKFPNRGSIVNMQSFKDSVSTGRFRLSECNRLGYLVSNIVYNESDIASLLSAATFITVTEVIDGYLNETNTGSFLFDRTSEDEILYLIWDYTNRKPSAQNDYTSTQKGTSKKIVVLGNDSDPFSLPLTVSIITGPNNGSAVVEADNSITYTHNNSDTYTDSITYIVNNGFCESLPAVINIDIAVACDASFTYNGNQGTFSFPISYGTTTGQCGITYNAFDIGDKFEIFWNGNLVATTGGNVSGSGTLLFNKTTPLPTTATIVVTATSEGTAWNIAGICPLGL